MLKFLGRMFGTEKALAGVVDGLKGGLDALVYTDQERERDAAAERAKARDMLIGWMDKSQGQNVARRFLAMIITVTWLFQYLASFGLGLAVIWVDNESVPRIRQSAEMVGGYADSMTGAVMLILAFYFAAPHIGSIIGPAMAKFGAEKK